MSPHSYLEKQDLLHRLAVLQHTLMQGVPVITRFLAQYLPLWNEKDYFAEVYIDTFKKASIIIIFLR